MKKYFNLLLSSKATMILLLILGAAMAVATFIEDKYDTVTARSLIYNTTWFELIFVFLIINLFGHLKAYNIYSKKKIGGLIFHLAFLLMIIGAFVTRYFGYEGNMHIRQGEASNIVFTADTYLSISYNDGKENINHNFPIHVGLVNKNYFHTTLATENKGNVEIKYKDIIHNAVEKIEENVVGGKDMIELTILTQAGMQKTLIKTGENKRFGMNTISYNAIDVKNGVNIKEKDGKLNISSPSELLQTTMAQTVVDTIKQDSSTVLKENYVYNANGLVFVFIKAYKNAAKKLEAGKDNNMMGGGNGNDAVVLDVTVNGKTYEANVLATSTSAMDYNEQSFDGVNIKFGFGNKPIELPFSLFLKNFIFEKYPGSDSPSSYKSEVTLIDGNENIKEDHSIFMNNVLDYKQYRFFQSSYDTDEKGTILSVNHDFWGTAISYLGYFLLLVGFVITLFSRNSRFLTIRRFANEARNKRKSIIVTILLLLGINGFVFSQATTSNKVISAAHADKFGHLLTQTFDGRFAPVHTLAIDLMHKISKKEKFNIEGKGKMNAMQVFIDMMAESNFWQQQKIIYVPQQSIRDIIGINTEFASFKDFFDAKGQYKLEKFLNESFRKKQAEKNKEDKEILKVDERVNIVNMILNGSMLKIFPEQNSKNNKWISWDDNASMMPLTGAISVINQDLNLKTFSYANIMQAYMFEIQNALSTDDYSKADKIIGYISDIQKQLSDPSLLPSDSKRNAEIYYNNADIFILLKNVYAALSVLLLLFAFIDNVKSEKSKFIAYTLNFLTLVLGIAFLYHTYGMGLRWYITGHAPWANGYEALILVAWGALIAGFSFAKNSKLTLAATTLLAFFVLMTASHSSYDPQLTNLQPVLKSYWLIIHVATLTISYGFLGLGFILGLMNLFIYLSKTKHNSERLDLLIAENTYIIEMNLIIGLMLATLGTFLGAVWANESWGKYWGWDAKETWALIIVVAYSVVLHMRFIPKFNNKYAFNVAAVLGFSSVIMTFVGVNYYLSKGMHSYGAGDTPVFPLWAWGTIFAIFILIFAAGIKEKKNKIELK